MGTDEKPDSNAPLGQKDGTAGTEAPAVDDEGWAEVAAGTAKPPEGLARKRLLSRARHASTSPDLAERTAAVAVARAIGGAAGQEVVINFLSDPDPEVRRAAFDAGVEAREHGLATVRAAIGAPDPAIATEAMVHLAARHDRSSTTRARSLLRHDNPAVRAAAATLLGIVAGPTLRPALAALLSDPDGEVRAAAARAVATLDGERPRPARRGWWEDPPEGEAETLDAARPAALPDRPAAPAAAAPQVDLADLLARLGAASDDARGELILRLRDLDPRDVMAQVRMVRASSPQDVARGAALVVGTLGLTPLASHTRQLLRHGTAGVRIAAVQALGSVGAAGVLTAMSSLLRDEDAGVRAAAAVSLARAGARTGRGALVSGWLDGVTDEDPAVVEAVKSAREILSE